VVANRFPVIRTADVQQSRVQDNIAALVTPVAKALQNTPIMGAPPPAWIKPTCINGFTSPASTAFPVASFHKDALGYVHVKMSVTHAGGTAALSTIYLLPVGYRPSETLAFAGMAAAGAYQGVFVLKTGAVQNRLIMAAGAVLYVNFSFLAEQ
jgi:hypothetical protein